MFQDAYTRFRGACMMLFHRQETEVIFMGSAFLAHPEGYLLTVAHLLHTTDDLLVALREVSSSHRGVIHSFLGSAAQADAFLSLGFYLGIGGPITFTKNAALKEALRCIPLERILLETDCPYLTPVPHRGKRNEPAYVSYVAEAVAKINGIALHEVEQTTSNNANRLFRLQ